MYRWKKEHEADIALGKSSAKSNSPAKTRLKELAYKQLNFLDTIIQDSDPEELESHVLKLLEFVSALNVGALFIKRIEKLTHRKKGLGIAFVNESREFAQMKERIARERAIEYRAQLQTARSEIYALIDELIGLQP